MFRFDKTTTEHTVYNYDWGEKKPSPLPTVNYPTLRIMGLKCKSNATLVVVFGNEESANFVQIDSWQNAR